MAKIESDRKTLEAVWKEINDKFADYKKARQPYERNWYENMAYCVGKHYVEWINSMNRLMEYPSPTYRVKLVVNMCFTIWTTMLAKLLRIEPTLYVEPGSSDEKSEIAADLGQKMIGYLWRVNRMDTNQEAFASRGIIYGTAFIIPYFNYDKNREFNEGDFTTENEEGTVPWMDENGKQKTDDNKKLLWIRVDNEGKHKFKKYHTGEADADFPDPFEIYPSPAATDDPESLDNFYRENLWMKSRVKAVFGVDVEADTAYEGVSIRNQIGMILNTTGTDSEKKKDGVTVRTYFENPSEDFPKGRIVTICPGLKVPLQYEELPAECLKMKNPLPLIVWRYIRIPGKFWGMGGVEQAIPLNTQYDKMRSRIIEHINLIAKGKLLIHNSSKIETPITDEPQIIHYAGSGAEPHYMDIKPLPAYLFQNIEALQQEIYTVTSIRVNPNMQRGIRSGKAMQVVNEMDDTPMGPRIKSYGACLAELGMRWLHIVRERYTEPRMIAVIGRGTRNYIKDFLGSMLEDNAEVVCQMGSGLPQSPSARQEVLIEYLKEGVLTQPEVKHMLELEAGEDFRNKDRRHESKANEENEAMENAFVRLVSKADNHVVHIKTHDDFTIQPLYEKLPDQVKHLFTLHREMHEEYLKDPKGMTTAAKLAVQKTLAESAGAEKK